MQNLLPLGPLPNILQEAFGNIIDNKVCNASYALSHLVTGKMLCAGYMSGKADTFQVCIHILSNIFLPKYSLNGSFYLHKIFFLR